MTREGDELARPLQRALSNNLWENCGVVRDEGRLRLGLDRLAELKAAVAQVDVRPSSEGYKDLALALDLRGSLAAAEATLRAALERRESRGAHQRKDYPELDPSLLVNFVVKLDANGEQVLSRVPVPPTPDDLQAWMKASEDLPLERRLLE
jgi:succinate dehydrogenase / fumarate reductase flavoprotein subunit